ncbi:MAG: hypothetical protein ACREPV_09505 [Lysobacter sp.]
MTLAIAYWCVLIAAILPLVWSSVAKASGEKFDNHSWPALPLEQGDFAQPRLDSRLRLRRDPAGTRGCADPRSRNPMNDEERAPR